MFVVVLDEEVGVEISRLVVIGSFGGGDNDFGSFFLVDFDGVDYKSFIII